MSDKDRRREAMRDRVKGPNSKSGESSKSSKTGKSGDPKKTGQLGEQSQPNTSGKPKESEMSSNQSKSASTSVKDRPSTLMYLPEDTDEELSSEFKRLDYECDRDLGWTPKKNQHYYPLVVRDGIEAIKQMSPKEFRERLDDLGLL
ncbi:hypothetical protein ACFQE1_03675 [Halobium palmae]|uniref:DUF8160 domain-containing protein n=1 Tax=Halobium palmae TaxID=1776492 RepID=A0ABD5RXL6_9EURY